MARHQQLWIELGARWGIAFVALAFAGLLCAYVERQQGLARNPQFRTSLLSPNTNNLANLQFLWGGDGLVTTGNYVDGRRTVPGLHTDCIPGRLTHFIFISSAIR